MKRAKLSPIFGAHVLPVRPGVYRWRFNLHMCEWRYALWNGKHWHAPTFTARRAAVTSGMFACHVMPKRMERYGLWRGLAHPAGVA